MDTYYYPSDIKTPPYENRKFTIYIKEVTVLQDAKTALAKGLEKAGQVLSFESVSATTTEEVAANKKANYKNTKDPTKDVIVLPLPNTFTDQQSHGWSRESGIVGTMGKELMSKTLGGTIDKIGGKGLVAGVLKSVAGGAANISADQAMGSVLSGASMRKPLFDPGYFQNYSGSEPRTFNCAWELVPNSAQEAADIMMIVLKLKEYSSPTQTVTGVSLLAPHYFHIELSNKYITSMISLDRVVITSISMDYGADGAMQQTADGFPKQMNLSMTLQEVDMQTSQDFNTIPVPTEGRNGRVGIT